MIEKVSAGRSFERTISGRLKHRREQDVRPIPANWKLIPIAWNGKIVSVCSLQVNCKVCRSTRERMLSDYVNRVMKEKGLTGKDIERRSNGEITDSTISNIRAGRNLNLSLDTIHALATGLDVNPVEVFLAASGQQVEREFTATRLAYIVQKLVDNSELFRLVEVVVNQKTAKIKAIKKILKLE